MTETMIAHLICSFVGTVCFSVLFNVPKRYYLCCGVTGMIGWIIYCAIVQEFSDAIATFFAACVVVLMSRILAIYMKCPITIFLVSGIFPLIPGSSVYYTAYYLVTGQLSLAAYRGMTALKVAFAIVLGIVCIVSIPKEIFAQNKWVKPRI